MTHMQFIIVGISGQKTIMFQLAVDTSTVPLLQCFLRNTWTLKTSIPTENGTLTFEGVVLFFLNAPEMSSYSFNSTWIHQYMSGWASLVSLGEVVFMLMMTDYNQCYKSYFEPKLF